MIQDLHRCGRSLQACIAATFLLRAVRRTSIPRSKLKSGDLLSACSTWCDDNRLPSPSPHEIARTMRQMGYVAGKSNGQRVWRGAKLIERRNTDWARMADEDALRRLMRGDALLAVKTFCRLVGIARSTFYEMQHRGKSPPAVRSNGRVFIRLLDAVRWCQECGRHAGVLSLYEWANTHLWPSAPIRNSLRSVCGASDMPGDVPQT